MKNKIKFLDSESVEAVIHEVTNMAEDIDAIVISYIKKNSDYGVLGSKFQSRLTMIGLISETLEMAQKN